MVIEKIFSVKNISSLNDLGFTYQGLINGELHRWHKNDSNIDLMAYCIDNSSCAVIAIIKSDFNLRGYIPNYIRAILDNGLHLEILATQEHQNDWDFNIWEPDKNDNLKCGLFYSGGQIPKLECPTLLDAFIFIKKHYDKITK